MKNDLTHLNDSLHAMLDQLTDPTDDDGQPLSEEELRLRIQRAGAVSGIAGQIIGVGRLALDAERLRHDLGPEAKTPAILGTEPAARLTRRGSD